MGMRFDAKLYMLLEARIARIMYAKIVITGSGFFELQKIKYYLYLYLDRSMDWQADQLLSSTSLQDERS